MLVLTGELGAGKTTFTRGLGEALGVRGTVTSPTFVLARTHPRAAGPPLVHVDAYRLTDAAELDDLDLDFAGSITVIEWGAGMVDAIAEEWLELVIERPTGAGEEVRACTGLSETNTTAEEDPAADDLEADAELIEPRTVRLRPVGPRGAELARLLAS